MSSEMSNQTPKEAENLSEVDRNDASVAVDETLDESALIGALDNSDVEPADLTVDEEALLRSPEVSYVEDVQQSVINEDKTLVEQSKETAVEESPKSPESPLKVEVIEHSGLIKEDNENPEGAEAAENVISVLPDVDKPESIESDSVTSAVNEPSETTREVDDATLEETDDTATKIEENEESEIQMEIEPAEIPSNEEGQHLADETPEVDETTDKPEPEENGKVEVSEHQNDPASSEETKFRTEVNEDGKAEVSEPEAVGREVTEVQQIQEILCCKVDEVNDTTSNEAEKSMDPSTGPKTEVKLSEINLLHHVKNIGFKDKKMSIVTQNENGPCPLVAIINVLLLKHEMTLPAHSEIVSASKLMEYIGNTILENIPKNLSGELKLNYEQNMHDAMAVLPKLQTGLDVNVKFTGVKDFEYTPECIIFDLLRIPLYHGWLLDPQTPEIVSAIGNASYNQIVEKAISQKCSDNADSVTEALIIEHFLERTASQLTYHGLSELSSAMCEEEIAVLFRNNHFSTIYKHGKELLQLVTDQGFLGESNVIWETLGSIDGDGQFVDGLFRTVPPKAECTTAPVEQQINQDFLVALSLQDQSEALPEELVNPTDDKTTQELLDARLARELQREEEEGQAAEVEAESGTAAQTSRPAETPPTKKNGCTIL